MDLAFLSGQNLILFILIFVRTAGIFTLTPIFGAQQLPTQVRLIIALVLTLVFMPLAKIAADLPVDVISLMLMVIREAAIGLTIGFVINMVFMAIETAGHMIDTTAGFAFATIVDPANGTHVALAARVHNLLAGLLFFATNSHHLVIKGLADSFTLAPLGEMSLNPAIAGGMTDLFAQLMMISLRIAMPVTAAVFLVDLSMAVVSRVVPQMNVLIVGFPLKLGAGIVGMAVAMPVVASMSQNMFSDMYNQMNAMVRLAVIH